MVQNYTQEHNGEVINFCTVTAFTIKGHGTNKHDMYGLGSLSWCGSNWRYCPNRWLLVCVCVLHSLPGLSSGSYLFPLQHVLSDRWLICSNKSSSVWFWRRGKIYGTKMLTLCTCFHPALTSYPLRSLPKGIQGTGSACTLWRCRAALCLQWEG